VHRFQYWRNAPFLVACTAYAINRWIIEPRVEIGFLHFYFNDIWLIPAVLPPILWLHRKLALRTHDRPPEVAEILLHLVFFAVLFEWLGPKFVRHASADPWDVFAYAAGAIIAGLWWHRERWLTHPIEGEL